MTDEEIVQSVQNGDRDAFGVLLERYEAKLLRYARKFLFTPHDAEDIVQETFLKAYVNINSFDPKRKFSPWIYRIAHNELINALKRKERDPLPFFDPDVLFPHPVAAETADQEVRSAEMKALLDTALDQVPSKYREALILFYIEEMGYTEIADILHVPVSTVGVRMKRGRDVLKKILKNHSPHVG